MFIVLTFPCICSEFVSIINNENNETGGKERENEYFQFLHFQAYDLYTGWRKKVDPCSDENYICEVC